MKETTKAVVMVIIFLLNLWTGYLWGSSSNSKGHTPREKINHILSSLSEEERMSLKTKPVLVLSKSCRDMTTCEIEYVPKGHITLATKRNAQTLSYSFFKEGEKIPYEEIDSFHTYRMGVYEENLYSCEDMISCKVKKVPVGYDAFGIKIEQEGVKTLHFEEGENIPYKKIDALYVVKDLKLSDFYLIEIADFLIETDEYQYIVNYK